MTGEGRTLRSTQISSHSLIYPGYHLTLSYTPGIISPSVPPRHHLTLRPTQISSLSLIPPRHHLSLIPPRHHRHCACLDVWGYRYTVFQTALPLLTHTPWTSSPHSPPQTSSPLCVSMSGVTDIPSSRRHYISSPIHPGHHRHTHPPRHHRHCVSRCPGLQIYRLPDGITTSLSTHAKTPYIFSIYGVTEIPSSRRL